MVRTISTHARLQGIYPLRDGSSDECVGSSACKQAVNRALYVCQIKKRSDWSLDITIKTYFDHLRDADKDIQYDALMKLLDITEEKVDWAYDVWGHLLKDLAEGDNHQRSRAAQFLCNLAKSDPEKRILKDFSKVWAVTKDKKFVTARHSLKSIWKIALAGPEQKELVLNTLADRFITGTDDKNYALTRYDIIESLRKLYDEIKDEQVKQLALNLVEEEEDKKYKKKYASVWKSL